MDPAHNHGDSSQMNEMMMHPMSFHFGSDETILFGFWKIQTAIGKFFFILLMNKHHLIH
jgi:hypothetical protein